MSLQANPAMLKEVNLSTVERLIYENGPLSKPELAKMTKLSLPTVNKTVDELVRRQTIIPVGSTGGGAGRRAVLYQRNENFGCVIALYYAEGGYIARLADMAGNSLSQQRFELDTGDAESALASTIAAVEAMAARAPTAVKAIGVGVPGVAMADGKLFGIPKIGAWEGFNLRESLAKRFGVPIHVENDVKLSAVGYYLAKLREQFDHVVYIYAGNGMGSGIIINKKLFRGATSFSGELGFMAPLSGEEPQRDYTPGGGYLEQLLDSVLRGAGNREALTNFFASIAANYTAIINPDAIVFGGEAFDASSIEGIRQRLLCYAPAGSIPQVIYDAEDRVGIHGLVLACIGDISTEVQFVQSVGV